MIAQHKREAWALRKAHEIVMREGYKLVMAAHNLDKQQTKTSTHALRKAIADSLLEAYQTSADDGRAYAADASSPVGIG